MAHGKSLYDHCFRRELGHSPLRVRFKVMTTLSFIIALSYPRERESIRSVTSEIYDYLISFQRHEEILLSQMNIPPALYRELLHNLESRR